jgi:hypothetical protein
MNALRQIILWLTLALACFLPASALTVTAPENHVWEIFSIGYDAPTAEAIVGYDRPARLTSAYDNVQHHRAGSEHRSALGTCTLFGQNAELKAADGAKPLSEWLKDDPDLLNEAREAYNSAPEWQGINPDTTPVFLRSRGDVDAIRAKPGESGGHHPHGLALGGPEGQTLTPTGDGGGWTNPIHSAATGLQQRIINAIKRQQ